MIAEILENEIMGNEGLGLKVNNVDPFSIFSSKKDRQKQVQLMPTLDRVNRDFGRSAKDTWPKGWKRPGKQGLNTVRQCTWRDGMICCR